MTNPVGCIYAAQGLEFDYVGVNWGRDLCWDLATSDWIRGASHAQDCHVCCELATDAERTSGSAGHRSTTAMEGS